MNFDQWWASLTYKEQTMIGENNGRFVWDQARKIGFEDLARQIEQMPFGNTSQSFAAWIKDQI